MSKKYGVDKLGALGPMTAEDWKVWLDVQIESPGNSWPAGGVVHIMKAMREMATVLVELEDVCKNVDPTAFPKDRQEDS